MSRSHFIGRSRFVFWPILRPAPDSMINTTISNLTVEFSDTGVTLSQIKNQLLLLILDINVSLTLMK